MLTLYNMRHWRLCHTARFVLPLFEFQAKFIRFSCFYKPTLSFVAVFNCKISVESGRGGKGVCDVAPLVSVRSHEVIPVKIFSSASFSFWYPRSQLSLTLLRQKSLIRRCARLCLELHRIKE